LPDTSRSILPIAASGSRPTVPVRGGCTDSRAQHIDWMLCACSEREAVPDRHWRHRRRGARICLVSLLPAVHLAPYVWNSVPLIQWFAGCTENCLTARSPDDLSLRNLQLI